MNDPTQLTNFQRSDLVAYVDGELDEDATQAMERVLSESSDARHDVDMLGRTFALLDTLPRPGASEEFSAKTLISLQAESASRHWRDRLWYRNARRGVVLSSWVVGLVVAAMVGYSAANRLVPKEVPRKDAKLVEELPVIENVDTYSGVDLKLLKELKKERVFDENAEDAPR